MVDMSKRLPAGLSILYDLLNALVYPHLPLHCTEDGTSVPDIPLCNATHKDALDGAFVELEVHTADPTNSLSHSVPDPSVCVPFMPIYGDHCICQVRS